MPDTQIQNSEEVRSYGTKITTRGAALLAQCLLKGELLRIKEAAAGDGGGAYYEPTVDQQELKNERWRGPIASSQLSANTPNMIDVKIVIGDDVGSFTVREMALYADDGTEEGLLLAICNIPDTEKVAISQGVSGKLTMMMHLLVADASIIDVTITPSLDVVSRQEMNQALASHRADLEAHPGLSNPNLLDNWYFADPINQRGQTEYTNGYTIDRWHWHADALLTMHNGCITLSTQDPNLIYLFQNFETEYSPDCALTFSVLDADYNLFVVTLPSRETIAFNTMATGAVITVRRDAVAIAVKQNTGETNIVAAKLELGPIQTLAHKEGDTWVLNDPPPNKALELLKCQRYQYVWGDMLVNSSDMIIGFAIDEHNILFNIPFPTTMRIIPAFSVISTYWSFMFQNHHLYNDAWNQVIGAEFSIYYISHNSATIRVTCNNITFNPGDPIYLATNHDSSMSGGVGPHKDRVGCFIFDANL